MRLQPVLGVMLVLACLVSTACNPGRSVIRGATNQNKPVERWEGDPVRLATMGTVLVLPFSSTSSEPGFKPDDFATRLANQITARGQVQVVFPQEAMAWVMEQNRGVDRHNAELMRRRQLGETLAQNRERDAILSGDRRVENLDRRNINWQPMDPVNNLEDAIRVGRQFKADAVLMGRITDFNAYVRPRITLKTWIVATGRSEQAAQKLAQLTQWGVPMNPGTAGKGVIWSMQHNFDAAASNIGREVKQYAVLRYTEEHAYDTDVYLRSPTLFTEYVGERIGHRLLAAQQEARKEAEQRALAEAKRREEEQQAVRDRLTRLMRGGAEEPLPDAERVMAEYGGDRRTRAWRNDVYNNANPDKASSLYAPDPSPRF